MAGKFSAKKPSTIIAIVAPFVLVIGGMLMFTQCGSDTVVREEKTVSHLEKSDDFAGTVKTVDDANRSAIRDVIKQIPGSGESLLVEGAAANLPQPINDYFPKGTTMTVDEKSWEPLDASTAYVTVDAKTPDGQTKKAILYFTIVDGTWKLNIFEEK